MGPHGAGYARIDLPHGFHLAVVRTVRDMPDHVAVAAFHLIETHATELHDASRRYHG